MRAGRRSIAASASTSFSLICSGPHFPWGWRRSTGTRSRPPTSPSPPAPSWRCGTARASKRPGPSRFWASTDDSSISNEALSDPTLRDDLIALGLDPTTGHQEGTINALGFDFQRSTADNPLNARRGYQLALHTESAGRLLPGTYNYLALSVDGRHYLPVGDRFVVASRFLVGTLDDRGDDGTNVPFSKKYFLGGATSLRGWGRYEVSPLSESGLPLGGTASWP